RPAVEIEVDDVLRARGKLRRPGRERIRGGGVGLGHEHARVIQQGGKAQQAQARAHLPQHLAARKEARRQMFERIHSFSMRSPTVIRPGWMTGAWTPRSR